MKRGVNNNKENNCCVVIPVYKEILNDSEFFSLQQCLSVLNGNDIFVVTFNTLNLDGYIKIFENIKIEYKIFFFDKKYFEGLEGYNQLCLNVDFYKHFQEFDYMLIYQLDCFVFRDELFEWCEKGYDYIGAPWFTDNSSYEEGAKLWKVGNGGFSLRKVDTFIQVLEYKKNVYSFKRAYKINKVKGGSFIDLFKMVVFGKNNRMKALLETWDDAEDIFYCLVMENTRLKLNVPSVEEAMNFAFEKSPEYLFKLNNQKLPFGCHAWRKYQYDEFWKDYIHYEK